MEAAETAFAIARSEVRFADRFVQGDADRTRSMPEAGQTVERAQAILLCSEDGEVCL
jgi:hypothetical protein